MSLQIREQHLEKAYISLYFIFWVYLAGLEIYMREMNHFGIGIVDVCMCAGGELTFPKLDSLYFVCLKTAVDNVHAKSWPSLNYRTFKT